MQPPTDYEALRAAVEERFDDLSDRLRRVGRHLLDQPADVAFETLAVVASRSGVQPSSIVRFAQAFGFDGAMPMQRVVKAGLLAEGSIAAVTGIDPDPARHPSQASAGLGDVAAAVIRAGADSLAGLRRTTARGDLAEAVTLMASADTVFVVGAGLSLPVATYLVQLLGQARRRALLVDQVGGARSEKLGTLRETDVAIAFALGQKRGETSAIVGAADRAGCPAIVIGDRGKGSDATTARVTLAVDAPDVAGLPSLVAPMCLSQALVAALRDVDTGSEEASSGAARR